MKKLILTFIVAIISICSFSQSVSYEMKNFFVGMPFINSDSTSSFYPITVVVGIVGDVYGFTMQGKNTSFKVPISFKQKYSDDEKYKLFYTESIQWVKENYPNVK